MYIIQINLRLKFYSCILLLNLIISKEDKTFLILKYTISNILNQFFQIFYLLIQYDLTRINDENRTVQILF